MQAPATPKVAVVLRHILHDSSCWGIGTAVEAVDLKHVHLKCKRKLSSFSAHKMDQY